MACERPWMARRSGPGWPGGCCARSSFACCLRGGPRAPRESRRPRCQGAESPRATGRPGRARTGAPGDPRPPGDRWYDRVRAAHGDAPQVAITPESRLATVAARNLQRRPTDGRAISQRAAGRRDALWPARPGRRASGPGQAVSSPRSTTPRPRRNSSSSAMRELWTAARCATPTRTPGPAVVTRSRASCSQCAACAFGPRRKPDPSAASFGYPAHRPRPRPRRSGVGRPAVMVRARECWRSRRALAASTSRRAWSNAPRARSSRGRSPSAEAGSAMPKEDR
jgi:hypothetical protein